MPTDYIRDTIYEKNGVAVTVDAKKNPSIWLNKSRVIALDKDQSVEIALAILKALGDK